MEKEKLMKTDEKERQLSRILEFQKNFLKA